MGYSKDFKYFIRRDFSEYCGKWIAIYNEEIIASSISITKVCRDVDKLKRKNRKIVPLFAKIPKKGEVRI